MKLHVGSIPESPDFTPDDSWRPLREPSPWLMQLLSLPFGLAACVAVASLWRTLNPFSTPADDSIAQIMLALAMVIPLHEAIHALFHPGNGRSNDSIIGLWPSRLVFYAHYMGEMSRNRFLTILVMPLITVSLAPLLVFTITGRAPFFLASLSIVNTLAACGDMFGICLVLFQLPASAVVRNHSWRTFWRIPSNQP